MTVKVRARALLLFLRRSDDAPPICSYCLTDPPTCKLALVMTSALIKRTEVRPDYLPRDVVPRSQPR